MDKKEHLTPPEKKPSFGEQRAILNKENEPVKESKESLRERELVQSELMREIELMEKDENTKAEAEKKVKKIKFLDNEEKLEHLLKIASEKGVAFAVQVARKMNDPYLLGTFHDLLAREGYYKKFTK